MKEIPRTMSAGRSREKFPFTLPDMFKKLIIENEDI
jgi:hypothetical protein